MIKKDRPEFFQYIAGLLKNKGCHLYRINGVEDHLHILIHLHPSLSLASMVKDIKLATTKLIKEKKLFPNFGGWQEGYGAFTYQIGAVKNLIEYIKNQEKHHKITSYEEEYRDLLNEHEIAFEEKYML